MRTDDLKIPVADVPALTLADFFQLIWRRKRTAGSAAALTISLTLLFTFSLTPLYQANATLVMERNRKAVQFESNSDVGLEYSALNTQRDLILSKDVLSRAIKNSDLLLNPAYQVRAPAEVLADRLTVTTDRYSWVVMLELKDEDPNRAERGLRAVLDVFFEAQAERQRQRSQDALAFLSTQVAETERKLDQARTDQERFQTEKKILTLDPDRNFIAQALAELTVKGQGLSQQVSASEALVKQLDAADQQELSLRLDALLRVNAIANNGLVVEQQRRLFVVEAQRAALTQKYLEKHPRLLEINQQISREQQSLLEAVQLAAAAVRSEYTKLRDQQNDLQERIRTEERRLAEYRSDLVSLQQLMAKTHSLDKLLDQLTTRLREEEVSMRLEAQQVSVVDKPHASNEPVNMRRSLFIAVALFLGIFSGITAPLVVEVFDRRLRHKNGISDLVRAPILAEIPYLAGLPHLGKSNTVQPNDVVEAFRTLDASMQLALSHNNACHIWMVISAMSGEGKSTVAARWAAGLAASGKQVLLVDGDMRNPSLHHEVMEICDRGLVALLAGEQDVAPVPTSYTNLHFLGAGSLPPNPAELLHSHCLPEWLTFCRERFDCVIIDSPPLLPVADALLLGAHVDGIVLVVREGVTARADIQTVMNKLGSLREKLVGVVYNGVRQGHQDYRYYTTGAGSNAATNPSSSRA
jgi:polysaccharide biosynthesis transport protein